MRSTFVKICGITRPDDAQRALALGAGAIGLNFVAGPRKISAVDAAEILAAISAGSSVVALIHVPDSATVAGLATILDSPQVTHLQLYGDYSRFSQSGPVAAAIAKGKRFKPWPVFRIGSPADVRAIPRRVAECGFRPDGLVLDTFSVGLQGGSGQAFDWNWLAAAAAEGQLTGLPPIILAGGLNADNVGHAIDLVQPWGVDVASGVENTGQSGIKDSDMMDRFIQAVYTADEERIS